MLSSRQQATQRFRPSLVGGGREGSEDNLGALDHVGIAFPNQARSQPGRKHTGQVLNGARKV